MECDLTDGCEARMICFDGDRWLDKNNVIISFATCLAEL